ncbi:MAG: hypothetical protein KA098_06325 [Phenylobacterium sp.]|nr:hypothetical protein [Phenylobacterium sp.]
MFLQQHVGYFAILAFIVSFFALAWSINGIFSSYSNHQFEMASEVWRGKADMNAVIAHLDFITRRFSSNDTGLFRPLQSISYAAALISSASIAMFTAYTLSARRPSFVSLTRQAEERMSHALKQHDNGFRNVAFSSAGAVALAACGRVVGEYLIRTFMG